MRAQDRGYQGHVYDGGHPLGQGEQRGGDPVRAGRTWASEVRRVRFLSGRGRKGAEQAAGWKVGITLEHVEVKTPQELSSPVHAEGESRGGSRFLSGEAHPAFRSTEVWLLCNVVS